MAATIIKRFREDFFPLFKKAFQPNILSLIAWQFANYAIPLALIAHFSRALGVEGFGVYGVTLGVINICMIITDWGFLYSSQRALVENSGDARREQAIIWETITAKLLLALLCTSVIACAIAWLGFRSVYALPLAAGIPALIANVLSLEWLLRGREKFLAFAIASVIGRLSAVPLAFLAVTAPTDAAWAIAVTSFGQFAVSLLSIALSPEIKWAARQFSVGRSLARVKDGLSLFVPIAAPNLFAVAMPPLIGFMSGPSEAGLYAGGERIRGAARMLFYPLTVIAYPRINILRIEDPEKLKSYVPRLIAIMVVCSGAACGLLALSAELVVNILLGKQFHEAIPVLRVLAASAFVSSVSNLLGTNVLVPFGMNSEFLRTHMLGLLIGFSAIVPLTYAYGALGASMGVLLGEFITLSAQIWCIRYKRPWT